MYIAVFKNNGKDYLRLMESYRTKSANGKVSIRKRIIHNIGPLCKFDDGEPNFLERLRESFRLGNPIIPELEEYTGKKLRSKNIRYVCRKVILNVSVIPGCIPMCFWTSCLMSLA